MQSELPKVLHPACGRPIIDYVLDAARHSGVKRIVAIIGHKADLVRSSLGHHPDLEFALQTEQLGTGHAVMMAHPLLKDHRGPVLVLAGDTPLLRGDSLKALLDERTRHNAHCVVGTAMTAQNQGLGRIVRDKSGNFLRIVEQKDATLEEQAIQEINTGCFAFDGPALFSALQEVRPNNSQAEYYLTDVPAIMRSRGLTVIASCKLDIEQAMGVNTQDELARVETVLKARSQH